jgi:hypothetical protein
MNDNSRTFPPSGLRPIGPIARGIVTATHERALADCVGRWRRVAIDLIADTTGTPEQRAVAWRFLKRWGVRSAPHEPTTPGAA